MIYFFEEILAWKEYYWLGIGRDKHFCCFLEATIIFLALIQNCHQVVYMGSIGVNASNLSAQGLFAFVHEWENR